MTADRVSLTEGYEGAAQANKNIATQGEAAQGLSARQHNATGDLLGHNKGAFATQAGNGSTAAANSLSAGALMHTNNASGGADFVRRTAQHEDTGAQDQKAVATNVETGATDLVSKINRA